MRCHACRSVCLPSPSHLSYNKIPDGFNPPVFLFSAKRLVTKLSRENYMSNLIRIALIGDYLPDVPAHIAIPRAIELAANDNGCAFEIAWIRTDSLELHDQQPRTLDSYDGIWCVPNS